MDKLYGISDLHFGHKNIIEYETRPYRDVCHMDKSLIKNWNSTVTKKDKILVAGDFSFLSKEDTKNIVSQLYGYKILIMGNHDRGRSIQWWYEVGFDEIYKHPILYKDLFLVSHEPPDYIPSNSPYFYLYGHVHGSEMYKTVTKTSSCLSVERWSYTPVSIDKIVELSKIV